VSLFSEANLNNKAFKQVLNGTIQCLPSIDPIADWSKPCNDLNTSQTSQISHSNKLWWAGGRSRNPLHHPHQKCTLGIIWWAHSTPPSPFSTQDLPTWVSPPDTIHLNAVKPDLMWCSKNKLAASMSISFTSFYYFKGDFNNNNKWLDCAVMFHAEKLQLITKEQYGSQKEKSVAIQCLDKQWLYDYIQTRHISLAICLNNSKSCYDRIVVLMVAALCLCRLGAPKVKVWSPPYTGWSTTFGQVTTTWWNSKGKNSGALL